MRPEYRSHPHNAYCGYCGSKLIADLEAVIQEAKKESNLSQSHVNHVFIPVDNNDDESIDDNNNAASGSGTGTPEDPIILLDD